MKFNRPLFGDHTTQLKTMMASLYLNDDLLLDEVGAGPNPILERLTRFRKANYLTLGLLIQPKDVGFNLLLNSLRAARGHHMADPDYVFDKYYVLDDMIAKNNGYFDKIEKKLEIRNASDFKMVQKNIQEMKFEDNLTDDNRDKIFDLFLVVKNSDLNNAFDIIRTQDVEIQKKSISLFYMSLRYLAFKFISPTERKNLETISKLKREFIKMDHFNMTEREKLDIFKKLGEENFYVKNSDIYKHFFTNNL